MGFITFMDKPFGRVARIVAGGTLIAWGFGFSGGTVLGLTLGVIGILPLAMGVWGRCLPELFVGHPRAAR